MHSHPKERPKAKEREPLSRSFNAISIVPQIDPTMCVLFGGDMVIALMATSAVFITIPYVEEVERAQVKRAMANTRLRKAKVPSPQARKARDLAKVPERKAKFRARQKQSKAKAKAKAKARKEKEKESPA